MPGPILTDHDQIMAEWGEVHPFATELLPESGNVRRYAQQQDGYGGRTEAWIADTGSIRLRLGERDTRDAQVMGERLIAKRSAIHMTYNFDCNMHLKDRVLIDATTYEVHELLDTGEWSLYNTAWGEAVDQPYVVVTNNTPVLQPVWADHDIVSYDFFHAGAAIPGVGKGHRRISGNWTVLLVSMIADTPPAGGNDVFNVLVNDVPMFTAVPKPTLLAGQSESITAQPDVFQLNDGDDLNTSTVSVAPTASKDVTLQVVVQPRE